MILDKKLVLGLVGLSLLAGCDHDHYSSKADTPPASTFATETPVGNGGTVAPPQVSDQAKTSGQTTVAATPDATVSIVAPAAPVRTDVPLTQYVDGMIGTDQVPASDTGSSEDLLGGFVNPVANVPFGMLAWGPETFAVDGTWSPRGYHYSSDRLTGFPLVNLDGVGCPSGGYFNVMPVNNINNTADIYDHTNERSAPGYYTSQLSSGIQAELTASVHSGIGRFTYKAGTKTPILKFKASGIVTDGDAKTISGSASGGGFCNNGQQYTLYFFGQVDQGFTATPSGSGTALTFTPNAAGATVINAKVAISYVSVANAKANLEAEIKDQTFDAVRANADAAWNKRLNAIQVSGGSRDSLVKFYTALYHSFFAPQTFSDVNGDYISMNAASAKANAGKDSAGRNRVQYTTFSSWDSYRSLAPLQALLTPEEASDQAQSLVNDANACGANAGSGTFPMWAEGNTNSDIMPGDGASIIVAQHYAYGARNFDTAAAKDIMVGTAENTRQTCRGVVTRPGMDNYLGKGFIAQGGGLSNATSVSTTMEYTSTDFAISRFVAALAAKDSQVVVGSEPAEAVTLLKRAGNWASLYNPDWKAKGQAQPQPQPRNSDGSWQNYVFDGGQDTYFREGNAEQYSYMVPYDIRGLFSQFIKDKSATPNSDADAIARLDAFTKYLNGGEGTPYLWIGNEPSFGIPFMYNWTSQPYKTQALVSRIVNTQFSSRPNGLPGNDDEGAMSGLFVWSALGLYPELMAVPGASLTSPLFQKAMIWQGDKELMEINAPKAPSTYIAGASLNGKPLDSTWINLDPTVPTKIDFDLTDSPTCWGSKPSAATAPPSFSSDGTQTPLLAAGGGLCG